MLLEMGSLYQHLQMKYHTNLHKLIATDYETCLIMGHSTHKHFLQKFQCNIYVTRFWKISLNVTLKYIELHNLL